MPSCMVFADASKMFLTLPVFDLFIGSFKSPSLREQDILDPVPVYCHKNPLHLDIYRLASHDRFAYVNAL